MVIVVGGAPDHVAGNEVRIVTGTGVVIGIGTMIKIAPVTVIAVVAERETTDIKGYGCKITQLE